MRRWIAVFLKTCPAGIPKIEHVWIWIVSALIGEARLGY